MSRFTLWKALILFLCLGCIGPILSIAAPVPDPQKAIIPELRKEATNLALHKSVKASSSFATSFSASMAVDGERNEVPGVRGWESADQTSVNHTEWIMIDLGENVSINRVDLYPRNDPARLGESFPVDFTIQISPDGGSWTTVVTRTGYPKPGNDVQRFTFESMNARYVKIVGTNLRYNPADSIYAMSFCEIEIYDDTEAQETAPALAGTSWKGEVTLDDGSTKRLNILIEADNRVSGEIVSSAFDEKNTKQALRGTYDPRSGAFNMSFGSKDRFGFTRGELKGTAKSSTTAEGQISISILIPGKKDTANGTWQISRQ